MCGPLIKILGRLSKLDGKDHTAAIRTGIPSAVASCQCGSGMDVDMLQQVLLAGWKVHQLRQMWIPLALVKGSKTRIKLKKTATVADYVAAYDALTEDQRNGPIDLVVK